MRRAGDRIPVRRLTAPPAKSPRGVVPVAVALLLLSGPAPLPAAGIGPEELPRGVAASGARDGAAALAGLDFSFRLDPRITRGLYMGDRWISPPRYVLHAPAAGASVAARVRGVASTGRRVPVEALWVSSRPGIATVAPAAGGEVAIAVHTAGESRVQVSAGSVSRELTVRVTPRASALLVEIFQVPPEGTPAARARAGLLASRAEKTGYAVGLDLGRRLAQRSSGLDGESVARGVADALEGTTLLTEGELREALTAHHRRLQAAQRRAPPAASGGDRTARSRELAARNERDGRVFLAGNAARPGIVTRPSGLQYEVLRAGDGERPVSGDTVVCHYRGTLVDGTVFDSSLRRGRPGTFSLSRVIPGWREALPLMRVGSKWKLYVPPDLGYGRRGTRGIPPNATLVFEVELLSIREPVGPASPTATSRTPG